MGESIDVRMARVEEGLVRSHEKIDHSDTRAEARHQMVMGKLDLLTERHWTLYAKMTGIAAAMFLVLKKMGLN